MSYTYKYNELTKKFNVIEVLDGLEHSTILLSVEDEDLAKFYVRLFSAAKIPENEL